MTLNDIRNRSGLLMLVIGLGMLGFIFMDLMSSGTSLFQKGQNLLLEVDGTEVTFTNFEKELEQNINIKYASAFGAVNISQTQRDSERDLLWDQKIEEILFAEKFNASGITVGKTEVWDLISGEITGNQAPLFGYFFRDQTESGEWNQYNPEMIQSWIELGSDNPQWTRYLFFKNNTVQERRDLKYYMAIKKGLYATKHDAKSYYTEQTQSTSGKYIYIPTRTSKSVIEPSEKEMKKYYKNHKLDFPNSPNREIKYAIFNLTASEADKSTILKDMKDLIRDKKLFNKRTNLEELELGFQNTDNLENFINQYGDNKYNIEVISKIDFEILTKKFTIKNDIIEPYIEKEICRMGRIINTSTDSISLVYLERELYASDQTLNETYSNVFDIINNNPKVIDLNIITESASTKPRTVILQKMEQSVPGLGSSRQIVRWAFDQETNLNEPKFFDLEDKYVISIVSNISENETKMLSEVYDDVKLILQNKNTAQSILDEIANLNYNSLSELAQALSVKVNSVDALRMNSDVFGTQGYNPGAVGAFFRCLSGEISAPFISKNGVFVFEKEKENTINYPSTFDRYQQLIQKNYDTQVDLLLVDILKKDKKITDNRFNFY